MNVNNISDILYHSPLGRVITSIYVEKNFLETILGVITVVLMVFFSHIVTKFFEEKSTYFSKFTSIKKIFFPLMLLILSVLVDTVSSFLSIDTNLVTIFFYFAVALLEVHILWLMVDSVFDDSKFKKIINKAALFLISANFILSVTGTTSVLPELLSSIFFRIGKHKIGILESISAIVIIFLSLLTGLYISSILASWVNKSDLRINARIAIINVSRTILIVLAVLVALPLIGIDATAINVFSGALGVGLGLSLNHIASNYINGLIMLIENRIQIGDCIMVNGLQGIVKDMSLRVTTIQRYNGTAIVLPNSIVSGGTVENFNMNRYTPGNRLDTSITLEHKADLKKAISIMVNAINSHKDVTSKDRTSARVSQISLEGIVVNMCFWVSDIREHSSDVIDEILKNIVDEFSENGIGFATRSYLHSEHPKTS
ncbi:mechanosensitive ion channel family protein [Candidatus Ichthyocystis sparus]|uniref:mechanosensitive ion channel family protein n=1 Tax=Candidatus Ichthyocystis sparus TaxID=1561004 RepID=UPI000B834255|nr:mechanosensitive ion channel domain-containing protein [Candidatus Ichthyocystis sparus]